jgi:hypothetical protein
MLMAASAITGAWPRAGTDPAMIVINAHIQNRFTVAPFGLKCLAA